LALMMVNAFCCIFYGGAILEKRDRTKIKA
jgi:hypothetical protein